MIMALIQYYHDSIGMIHVLFPPVCKSSFICQVHHWKCPMYQHAYLHRSSTGSTVMTLLTARPAQRPLTWMKLPTGRLPCTVHTQTYTAACFHHALCWNTYGLSGEMRLGLKHWAICQLVLDLGLEIMSPSSVKLQSVSRWSVCLLKVRLQGLNTLAVVG